MRNTRKLLAVTAIITAVISILNTAFFMKDSFLYSLDDLPEGTKCHVSASPDGDNIVNIYRVENLVGSGVRAAWLNDGKEENIYWETGINTSHVYWVDNKTVSINGVTLQIGRDKYDTRRFGEELPSVTEDSSK